MKSLTEKETCLLKAINEDSEYRIAFNINSEKLVTKCQLNPLQVDEMVQRFKRQGLLKKDRTGLYTFAEAVFDLLAELI